MQELYGSGSGTTGISKLSDVILLHIFSHLSCDDFVFNLGRACRRWRRLAYDRNLWTLFDVGALPRTDDVTFSGSAPYSHTPRHPLRRHSHARRHPTHTWRAAHILEILCRIENPEITTIRFPSHLEVGEAAAVSTILSFCDHVHTLEISPIEFDAGGWRAARADPLLHVRVWDEFCERALRRCAHLEHVALCETSTPLIPGDYFPVTTLRGLPRTLASLSFTTLRPMDLRAALAPLTGLTHLSLGLRPEAVSQQLGDSSWLGRTLPGLAALCISALPCPPARAAMDLAPLCTLSGSAGTLRSLSLVNIRHFDVFAATHVIARLCARLEHLSLVGLELSELLVERAPWLESIHIEPLAQPGKGRLLVRVGFDSCPRLTVASLADGANAHVTAIFLNCPNLRVVQHPASSPVYLERCPLAILVSTPSEDADCGGSLQTWDI